MNEDSQNARNVCCGPSHTVASAAWTELASSTFAVNSHRYPRTLMFSDWSGEHQGAAYQTISMLLCDEVSLAQWLNHADQRRSVGRTMSYKTLNHDVLRR